MSGPVLFCYDGSEDSGAAIAAAGELIARPAPAIVLTIWQTAAALLAQAGGFAVGFGDEQQFDAGEAGFAWQAAEEAASRARELGYEATARVEQAKEGPAHTIIDVANELDARLVVCGRRGRGIIRSTPAGKRVACRTCTQRATGPHRPQYTTLGLGNSEGNLAGGRSAVRPIQVGGLSVDVK
jgi:predicted outer membrane repeat protein